MKRFTINFISGTPVLAEFVSETMTHILTCGVDEFINFIEFPCSFEFPSKNWCMTINNKEEYDKVIVALTDENFMKQFSA